MNSIRTFDPELWDEKVREVIAERGPDFTYVAPATEGDYASCKYFDIDGSPSCLFGAVLDKLGFGPGDVHEGDDIGGIMEGLWGPGGVPEKIVLASADAQSDQDCGFRYSTVLSNYERHMERA